MNHFQIRSVSSSSNRMCTGSKLLLFKRRVKIPDDVGVRTSQDRSILFPTVNSWLQPEFHTRFFDAVNENWSLKP